MAPASSLGWDPRPWVKHPVWLELHVFSATHPALRPLTKLSKCNLHREAPFPENKQQTAIWCLGLTLGGAGGSCDLTPGCPGQADSSLSLQSGPSLPCIHPSLSWLYYFLPLRPHPDALLLPTQQPIPHILPDLADQDPSRSLRDWRPHPFCVFLSELLINLLHFFHVRIDPLRSTRSRG